VRRRLWGERREDLTKRRRRLPPPRVWPWLRAVAVASATALVVSLGGSAWFWIGVAYTHERALAAAAPRAQAADPPLKAIRARLASEEALLQSLKSRIPQTLTSIEIADDIYAAALRAGVVVQSVSFGATEPSPVAGYQGTQVSVEVSSPGPLATVGFLQAVESGAIPASAAVSQLSLANGPQEAQVTFTFYSAGGLG
jgi:hypothetical protein